MLLIGLKMVAKPVANLADSCELSLYRAKFSLKFIQWMEIMILKLQYLWLRILFVVKSI